MIKGERRRSPLERSEEIFQHLTEYDIYRFYLGDFTKGEPFCNPFRGESNPSMDVRELNDRLFHHDYGDMYWRGGCLDLVMQRYGCDLASAIKWIEKDFGLSDVGGKSSARIVTWQQPLSIPRNPPKFHIITRPFNAEELKYWSSYLQDISDLRRENIYVPQTIYRNLKRLPIRKGELLFCYYYPDIDKWKLYRPGKPKRTKDTPLQDWKWDTNLDFKVVENLEVMRGSQKGLLTGKKKDRMYLMKLLETDKICNVQAEDPACLPDEALEILKGMPQRWANGDDDPKGKEFTGWLEGQGFSTILGDMPDMGQEQGHEAVKQYFKSKGWRN